ncbi:MAG: hypothetical protein ACLGIA_07995 [Actinomycetes bacterium]
MKVVRSVLVGLVTGAALAFLAALLRPRPAAGYDPWRVTEVETDSPTGRSGPPVPAVAE